MHTDTSKLIASLDAGEFRGRRLPPLSFMVEPVWKGCTDNDMKIISWARRWRPSLLMMACRVYVFVLFPWVLAFLRKHYLERRERHPVYPDAPSIARERGPPLGLCFRLEAPGEYAPRPAGRMFSSSN